MVLTNYPEGQIEQMPADNNPQDPEQGKRLLPFGRELYIEAEDFMEDPPKKYHRLTPGGEVRLKPVSYTHLDVYKRQGWNRLRVGTNVKEMEDFKGSQALLKARKGTQSGPEETLKDLKDLKDSTGLRDMKG